MTRYRVLYTNGDEIDIDASDPDEAIRLTSKRFVVEDCGFGSDSIGMRTVGSRGEAWSVFDLSEYPDDAV